MTDDGVRCKGCWQLGNCCGTCGHCLATAKDAIDEIRRLRDENVKMRAAIKEHHAQRADDRCVEDDDRLYAAAGLSKCDRRVGDKFAMLKNCLRFIENRCEGGGPWRTYAQLEEDVRRLRAALARIANEAHGTPVARMADDALNGETK